MEKLPKQMWIHTLCWTKSEVLDFYVDSDLSRLSTDFDKNLWKFRLKSFDYPFCPKLMKILFVSNLFPDIQEPVRGLDNAIILHHLKANHSHEIRVISPRSRLCPLFSEGNGGKKPREEDHLFSPQFPEVGYVPKFGSRWNDILMEMGLQSSMKVACREWKPDAVLGSWLFPDGCALSRICVKHQLPLVLITQGSDTHQYLQNSLRKRKIIEAIRQTRVVICRSGDLKKRLLETGVPEKKLRVIYNGIDPETFKPIPRETARAKLGIRYENPVLLFVGNLLPVKNPHFLLRVFALLNERRAQSGSAPAKLQIVGQGPLEGSLRKEASALASQEHIEFLGRLASNEIALRMNASDVFCLTSENEGFPNVLLEAMACGLRIVSTDVGGISEKIELPAIGRLVENDNLKGFVNAIEETLNHGPDPLQISRFNGSWNSTAIEYEKSIEMAITSAVCNDSLGS